MSLNMTGSPEEGPKSKKKIYQNWDGHKTRYRSPSSLCPAPSPKNVPLAQRTMQLSPFQDQQTVRAQKPREESRPFKVQRWSFYLELEDAKTPAPAQKEKREDRQQKSN